MRHHPSCWNKVLAKLGFRRVSRRYKRQAAPWGRMSRIEALEERRVLASDVNLVPTWFGVTPGNVGDPDHATSLQLHYSIEN